jgi:hypothetical protein
MGVKKGEKFRIRQVPCTGASVGHCIGRPWDVIVQRDIAMDIDGVIGGGGDMLQP